MKQGPRKTGKKKRQNDDEEEEGTTDQSTLLFHDVADDSLKKTDKEGRKRKRQKPTVKEPIVQVKEEEPGDDDSSPISFASFDLDERLMKAIAQLGWQRPTLVQEKLIPLALEGVDVIVRARTGSGKTAAFAIPIIQRILLAKERAPKEESSIGQSIFALILSPTKELCSQLSSQISALCSACRLDINIVHLSSANNNDPSLSQRMLADCPDIVIATPGSLCSPNWTKKNAENLQVIVLDEADLLLSFGYEKEIKSIASTLPQSHQTIFTSATLPSDIDQLRKTLVKRQPVILKLKESQLPDSAQLTQYRILCSEEDRFVLIYALFKLRLIRGKTIIFVANTDRCFRLRLFLEQFGISSCVLNSEMPVSSRCHVVHQFNEGRYEHVIASDLAHMDGNVGEETMEDGTVPMKKKKKRRKTDNESGVSRGIDFQHVSNVINFDFPTSVDEYIHRVGRTARGWNKGTALSFATPTEHHLVEEVERVLKEQMGGGHVLKPYEFRMEELDGFRYRARDVMRAVTSSAVTEARLSEIKAEALRSKKLAAYFAANPREQALLVHDKALHTVRVPSAAIRDVPEYIVPMTLRGIDYRCQSTTSQQKRRNGKKNKPMSASQKRHKKKMEDPLRSFEA